jgi:dienelactone hydrolase
VPQREVARRLFSAVVALLLLAPVLTTGWLVVTSAAFLTEFLAGDRLPLLSWITRAPTVRQLAVPGVAADIYEVESISCHLSRRAIIRVAVRRGVDRPHPICAGSSLVLVHGLAPEGKNDVRLRRAARLLARSGFAVAVPTITGLTGLRLRPGDIESVVETVRAMPGPVSIVGVSVGAGPALLAAADPRVREEVRAVLSLGGYASATELVRYYLSGDPRLTRMFVDANPDLMDASARQALVTGQVDALSPELRRLLDDLSPERVVGNIRGRLLIVHGREDPLVPVAQSTRLAEAARAAAPRVAIVGLVDHVGWRSGGRVLDALGLWAVTYDLIAGS